jgi:hypothetical protein
VFDVPSTATTRWSSRAFVPLCEPPEITIIVCVDSPSPAPEQRQRKGSPQQGLMRPKVAGAVTSVWLSIGILLVVLQRPSDGCDSPLIGRPPSHIAPVSGGILAWPWGLFYGLVTLGLFGCSVVYFDELPRPTAKARWICNIGALIALLLAVKAFGHWSSAASCGR